MFSLNKWLKTPDVDGRYQPIVRDFHAAIPEVLDALPRKYFQQPVSWMTQIFHQFDDVSLMAAQGTASNSAIKRERPGNRSTDRRLGRFRALQRGYRRSPRLSSIAVGGDHLAARRRNERAQSDN